MPVLKCEKCGDVYAATTPELFTQCESCGGKLVEWVCGNRRKKSGPVFALTQKMKKKPSAIKTGQCCVDFFKESSVDEVISILKNLQSLECAFDFSWTYEPDELDEDQRDELFNILNQANDVELVVDFVVKTKDSERALSLIFWEEELDEEQKGRLIDVIVQEKDPESAATLVCAYSEGELNKGQIRKLVNVVIEGKNVEHAVEILEKIYK